VEVPAYAAAVKMELGEGPLRMHEELMTEAAESGRVNGSTEHAHGDTLEEEGEGEGEGDGEDGSATADDEEGFKDADGGDALLADGSEAPAAAKEPPPKQYLIKWKGLSYTECTWEKQEDIHDDQAIARYYRMSHPPKWSEQPPSDPFQGPLVQYPASHPPQFKNNNTLRQYQLDGMNWILFSGYNKRNVLLADEMGLGKTIQSVSVLHHLSQVSTRGQFLTLAGERKRTPLRAPRTRRWSTLADRSSSWRLSPRWSNGSVRSRNGPT
jgi:hypothetical protein